MFIHRSFIRLLKLSTQYIRIRFRLFRQNHFFKENLNILNSNVWFAGIKIFKLKLGKELTVNSRPISYSCYQRYNYSSYLSIYSALVKRNHSVTMVLPMLERLSNWPSVWTIKCTLYKGVYTYFMRNKQLTLNG